jgi:hypothetical protein
MWIEVNTTTSKQDLTVVCPGCLVLPLHQIGGVPQLETKIIFFLDAD